jgi:hypothetical protein
MKETFIAISHTFSRDTTNPHLPFVPIPISTHPSLQYTAWLFLQSNRCFITAPDRLQLCLYRWPQKHIIEAARLNICYDIIDLRRHFLFLWQSDTVSVPAQLVKILCPEIYGPRVFFLRQIISDAYWILWLKPLRKRQMNLNFRISNVCLDEYSNYFCFLLKNCFSWRKYDTEGFCIVIEAAENSYANLLKLIQQSTV